MAKLTIEGFRKAAEEIINQIDEMSPDEIQSFEDWVNDLDSYNESELLSHFKTMVVYKNSSGSVEEFQADTLK